MFNLIIAYLTMTPRSPQTTNIKLPIVTIKIIRQFRKVSFGYKLSLMYTQRAMIPTPFLETMFWTKSKIQNRKQGVFTFERKALTYSWLIIKLLPFGTVVYKLVYCRNKTKGNSEKLCEYPRGKKNPPCWFQKARSHDPHTLLIPIKLDCQIYLRIHLEFRFIIQLVIERYLAHSKQ